MKFMLLAHHRSGSNFVTEVLQRNPSLSVIDEPLSMHTSFFPDHDLLRWGKDDYMRDRLHNDLMAHPGAYRFLRDLLAYLGAVEKGTVRGFKETLLFEKLSWLAQVIPDLRIIHLVRDPRAVICSVLNHELHRALWRYDITVPRYMHRYQDLPFPVSTASDLDLCIASWQIRHYEAQRSLAMFNHVTIQLEQFIREPETALQGVSNLLGTAVHQAQRQFIKRSQLESRGGPYSTFRSAETVLHSWRSRLSATEVQRIEISLELEMKELGYDCSPPTDSTWS